MKKFIALGFALAACGWARAETPDIPLKINFQGTFSSGPIVVNFYLADAPNSSNRLPTGTPWNEELSTTTADGNVNYVLGSVNPIPKSIFTGPTTQRFLEVFVDGQSHFSELVSVPYAFRAAYANELAGGATVYGNLKIASPIRALHLQSPNDQLILEDSDGPVDGNQWVLKADGGSLNLLTANDNYNSFASALRLQRTGIGVDGIYFPSGNVGIGTESPTQKLHLFGSGQNARIVIENADNGGNAELNFLAKTAGGAPKYFNLFNAGGDRLGLWTTDAGDVFAISANGNVGIGSTHPLYKLDVQGNVNAQGFTVNGVALNPQSQWVDVPGGISYSAGRAGIGIVNPLASVHLGGGSQTTPTFRVDGSSHALFVNAGNLGIGTLHPKGRLHIADTGEQEMVITRTDLQNRPTFRFGRIIKAGDGDPEFRFLYSDDATEERAILEFDKKGIIASVKTGQGSHFEGFFKGDGQPVFRLNSYPAMQLEFGPGGSNVTDVAMRRVGPATLAFITGDTTLGAIERILIDADGNVGIAKVDPAYRLDVNGIINASDIYKNGSPLTFLNPWSSVAGGIRYSSGEVIIGAGLPSSLLDVNGGSLTIRGANAGLIVASGNVGIGSANPAAKLDVSGEVRAVSFAGDGSGLTGVAVSSVTAAKVFPGNFPNGVYTFPNSVRFPGGIWSVNGNVGLGTSNPSAKLQVLGAVQANSFAGDGSALSGIAASSVAAFNVAPGNFANGAYRFINQLALPGGAWLANGNLGVGTVNPTSKLHVLGTVQADAFSGDGSALSDVTASSVAAASVTPGTFANNVYRFTNQVQLPGGAWLANGNLGIGTANPASKLQVVGTVQAGAFSGDGSDLTHVSASSVASFNVSPGNFSNGAYRFVNQVGLPGGAWLANGNVGLGTVNPSAKLQVLGTVQATLFAGNGSALTNVAAANVPAAGVSPGAFPNGAYAFQNTVNLPGGIWSAGGNVGVGTEAPRSAFHVAAGYIQIPVLSGAPPAGDCNSKQEEGRMKFDSKNNRLYICSGKSGWVSK